MKLAAPFSRLVEGAGGWSNLEPHGEEPVGRAITEAPTARLSVELRTEHGACGVSAVASERRRECSAAHWTECAHL
jgi:hypothetical protein